jgi:hypothetical protein
MQKNNSKTFNIMEPEISYLKLEADVPLNIGILRREKAK